MEEYNKVKEILNSDESQILNYKPLADYLSKHDLLNNDDLLINYASNNDVIFKEIYEEHYIKKSKRFVNFTMFNSFCMSWLMYLYH